jgi:hypothetical protein
VRPRPAHHLVIGGEDARPTPRPSRADRIAAILEDYESCVTEPAPRTLWDRITGRAA